MLFPKSAAVFAAFAVAGASAQKCKCPSNPCTTNLVKNGDFDDPLNGSPWEFTNMEITKIKPRSSPQAALAEVRDDNLDHSIEQSITLIEGKKYALRYYYAVISGSIPATAECQIIASVDNSDFDVNPVTATPLGEYKQHEFIFTAAATSNLEIIVRCTPQAPFLTSTWMIYPSIRPPA
ncbi:hypothetical protein V2G26_002737 [Clonostachys chloroleuca]